MVITTQERGCDSSNGGHKKQKSNDDKNNKTFLERIRLDSEPVELLTEYSKHTLFCLTARVECQRACTQTPPRINDTSRAEWWRHCAGLHDPTQHGYFLFHFQLPIHIPLPKQPIRPGGCAGSRRQRQTIDRFDCDAHSFSRSGC